MYWEWSPWKHWREKRSNWAILPCISEDVGFREKDVYVLGIDEVAAVIASFL